MVLLPILQGSDTILFFEYVLKVGLTGKTQQAADLGERFCRVGQQAFGLLQLAAGDEGPHVDAKIVLEFFCHIGAAFPDVSGHVVHTDRFVGVIAYERDAFIEFRGEFRGDAVAGDPLAEIDGGVIEQKIDVGW